MIDFYNSEASRYLSEANGVSPEEFSKVDTSRISWTRGLRKMLSKGRVIEFSMQKIVPAIYRPFNRTWLYYDRNIIEMILQNPKLFPATGEQNLAIDVSGVGARSGFSALMIDRPAAMDFIEKGQCFPLYKYEKPNYDSDLFTVANGEAVVARRDAITDEGLAHYQASYPGKTVTKEDLFYYIYGLLHAPDYRKRFKNNLSKSLPRIPAVRSFEDFRLFVEAGRALGELHVNFEEVEPYMVTFKEGDHRLVLEAEEDPVKFYRVEKMKFGGKSKDKDRSTVVYNKNITIQNIPLQAYEYIVNGKPALEWVMERQMVKPDKSSGIVNDANDFANETVGDPRYPLDLFCRVITVSLETMRIVNGLPKLDIH